MGSFSLTHWLILGLIVLLLFGGNRFSAMMGDVAKGLKGFKQGLVDDAAPPAEPVERKLDHAPQRSVQPDQSSATRSQR